MRGWKKSHGQRAPQHAARKCQAPLSCLVDACYIGVILGFYWDSIRVILGLYWGYIGVIFGVILGLYVAGGLGCVMLATQGQDQELLLSKDFWRDL